MRRIHQLEDIRPQIRVCEITGDLFVIGKPNRKLGKHFKLGGVKYSRPRTAWLMRWGEWPSGKVFFADGDQDNMLPDNLISDPGVRKKRTRGIDCGTYVIRHIETGRVYVGSTKVCFAARFRQHRWSLLKGKHDNRDLQIDFNKCGLSGFAFEVIERLSPESCLDAEQKLLNENALKYNYSPTAGSCVGVRHTDEARSRMSAAHVGNTHPPEVRAKISENHKTKRYKK